MMQESCEVLRSKTTHMKSIKALFFLMIITCSSAFGQSKGEMPFTTSSPNGNQLLRNAWVALADAKFDESEKYRQELLSEDPDCGMAYVSIFSPTGEELEENVKIAESKNLSPDERMFIKGLMAKLENKSTQEYFDPLISKYPSDYYLHLLIMLYNSDTQRAIEIGENIMKRKPKLAPTLNLLGYLYMEKNDMAKAESFFDKYLSLRPDLANPYDSKGDYFMRAGKIEEAIRLYEKAVAMGMSASAEKVESAKLQLKFPKPTEDDQAKIKTLITASIDAYQTSDVNQLLKDYSEHALKIWGHNTVTVGLPGVRQSWLERFKNFGYKRFEGATRSIYGAGPIAITYGAIESKGRNASEDQAAQVENVIYFLEKDGDGTWKILLDHFYAGHDDNPELSPEDRQQIARLINAWDNALTPGEPTGDKQLESMASLYSQQAIEIFPNLTSNIGLGNIRARWDFFGRGARFETNRLGPLGIEGLGDRAIAWGIATQKLYPGNSKELMTYQFPWAMMLTKEKDQSWKILAIHWSHSAD